MLTFRHSAPALAALLVVGLTAPVRAADLAAAVDSPGDGPSRVVILDPEGKPLRSLGATTGMRLRAPNFAPDGKSLAYHTVDSLGIERVWIRGLDSAAGVSREVAQGSHPQWSSDGKRVLYSRRRVNDWFAQALAADGSEREDPNRSLGPGRLARWSPGGGQLAVVVPVIVGGVDRWQIQVMALGPAGAADAHFRLTLPEMFGQVVSLEWSPDGERLLYTVARSGRFALYVSGLSSPEPQRLPAGDPGPDAAYGVFSPDGKSIAFRRGSQVSVMKADGTDVRALWTAPGNIHGLAWGGSAPVLVARNEPVKPEIKLPEPKKPEPKKPEPEPKKPEPEPKKPEPEPKKPEPVVNPVPKPDPPKPMPMPAPLPKPTPRPAPAAKPRPALAPLGPAQRLQGAQLQKLDKARSPVSMHLAAPKSGDFSMTVAVQAAPDWADRRQGVGITVESEDGSLYRGTVIFSGAHWATIQGRPRGGKVRLIDGKQLPPDGISFKKGFKLTLRRAGTALIVLLDDQEVLNRPLLTSAVKTIALTLENFDAGEAVFSLGAIYFREAAVASPPPAGTVVPTPARPGKPAAQE